MFCDTVFTRILMQSKNDGSRAREMMRKAHTYNTHVKREQTNIFVYLIDWLFCFVLFCFVCFVCFVLFCFVLFVQHKAITTQRNDSNFLETCANNTQAQSHLLEANMRCKSMSVAQMKMTQVSELPNSRVVVWSAQMMVQCTNERWSSSFQTRCNSRFVLCLCCVCVCFGCLL